MLGNAEKMRHRDQVLALLQTQIGNEAEVKEIKQTAEAVVKSWVDPLGGGQKEVNGLIYGLVQSGKTGVLTVTGAMGADEGYKTLIILTSDIEPLYQQTFNRIQEAFPGIDIIGKREFRDPGAFLGRIRSGTCAIVSTKNSHYLSMLIQNFQQGKIRGLTCLIIDDEADQASLNTRASRGDSSRSAINDKIRELRGFFDRTTYLQVTATPQALFLQQRSDLFRPKFTVLSHPGKDYVGGEDFFGPHSRLVREFDLNDIAALAPGPQPSPTLNFPSSLVRALDTFMIGATYKRLHEPDQNCAFLCHVSTRTTDHSHIVDMLRKYKSDLPSDLNGGRRSTVKRFEYAYNDLVSTNQRISNVKLDQILETIKFFSPGIIVKLVNGQTDDDVAMHSPYNLFVGGNKLGRGVTIKNLLVSYYGRNPRTPQADTVLQHARMYGYRRKDIGLLRLFLPSQLHTVFRAINQMERALRDLIGKNPTEEFRGIYVERGVSATRRNILVPGAVGVYSAGGSYNPAQVVRDSSVDDNTKRIDQLVQNIGNKQFVEAQIEELSTLIGLIVPDPGVSERVWDSPAILGSLAQIPQITNPRSGASQTTGYIYVDRGRRLVEARRENQGILSGGEASGVPADKVTLFLLRTEGAGKSHPTWWPQVRFPGGRYAFAFAL